MHVRPELRDCSMVLAFDGWNDAGAAASSALSFINEAIQSVPLAEIDPEEFYDFTVNRPEVVLTDGNARHIEWPSMEFRYGSIDGSREIITGLGCEPHLRWRSFCECVVQLVHDQKVQRVVLLGGYQDDVVYSQPVQVTGFASDPKLLERVGVRGSGYEGPTGIVGVLADRLQREGVDVASFWAGLPHYIRVSPNPRGSLALVQKLTASLDFRIDEEPLQRAAAEFEERINELVASDSELSEYVKQLKRRDFAQ
jgi:proteasome assembly chaperone (PAC2) family protein